MSKRNGKTVQAEAKKVIRCAIYTRKSTEEGLTTLGRQGATSMGISTWTGGSTSETSRS